MREEVPLEMHAAPRFDPIKEQAELLSYLNANGYVVVKQVADEAQIKGAKREFWEYMESCTSALKSKGKVGASVERHDVSTWSGKQWLPNERTGILNAFGLNHSDFLWSTRLLPKVKAAFAAIWETEDLLVSFDAGNAFRPWKHNPEFLTSGGWWHVDQNGLKPDRRGRVCVQGLVTYFDVTEDTGGFCLIPRSHKDFEAVCKRSPTAKMMTDFVGLDAYDPLLQQYDGKVIAAKAGDMILWDSRTVHCNAPALSVRDYDFSKSEAEASKHNELIRLVAYTCMVPKAHATAEVVNNRKKAFNLRIGTSHWPTMNVAYLTGHNVEEDMDYLKRCTKEQLRLVGYSSDDITRIAEHS